MSAFQFEGGTAEPAYVKLTGTGVTTIIAATKKTSVVHLICQERDGKTPTLTVEVFDGTNSFYLACLRPVVARETVKFNDGYVLQKGWSMRVTASIANSIDVHALFILPQ